MPNRLFPSLGALVACVVLAACGSSSSSPSTPKKPSATTPPAATGGAPQSTAKIAIRNYMYQPANLTVKAGAKVTFTNYDQTAHTATSNSPGFDTGTIEPGKSATITIKKPGTYTYHCSFHAFMVAHVTVAQ